MVSPWEEKTLWETKRRSWRAGVRMVPTPGTGFSQPGTHMVPSPNEQNSLESLPQKWWISLTHGQNLKRPRDVSWLLCWNSCFRCRQPGRFSMRGSQLAVCGLGDLCQYDWNPPGAGTRLSSWLVSWFLTFSNRFQHLSNYCGWLCSHGFKTSFEVSLWNLFFFQSGSCLNCLRKYDSLSAFQPCQSCRVHCFKLKPSSIRLKRSDCRPSFQSRFVGQTLGLMRGDGYVLQLQSLDIQGLKSNDSLGI